MPRPRPTRRSRPTALSLPTAVDAKILLIRGQRVLLDRDLAAMYGVSTGVLNQAVSRNRGRFPEDFMFQLDPSEFSDLKSQSVISSRASGGWGGSRHRPYAFTEQGVAMLSSVLRGPRAVQVNIEIMRAFVRLRRLLASNADLAKRLDELESRYDRRFKIVFDAIRALMEPPDEPDRPRRRIGFSAD